MDDLNLTDFTERLLPLTVFRRRAGEVLVKLSQVGTLVITKDGKPVAKLSSLTERPLEETPEQRLSRLKPLIGGFRLGRGMTPKQMNKLLEKRYGEMLPR